MSRCNIKEKGYIDRDWEHHEYRVLAEEKLKLRDSLVEELREQLRSISTRMREGNTVWIDYDSGERLYLKAYTTEPPQGEKPAPYDAALRARDKGEKG